MSKWPRKYLLDIYATAISSGKCTVSPISASDAKSLALSLYRLRRRSDTSNVTFITADHHLVTAMDYQPASQSISFVFDDPDAVLPTLTSGNGTPPEPSNTLPPEFASEKIEALPDFDTDIVVPRDLVASLQKKAADRDNG